jgi:hypothetical protein
MNTTVTLIQHNGLRHNDFQNYATQHHDIGYKNIQHNDIQQNDIIIGRVHHKDIRLFTLLHQNVTQIPSCISSGACTIKYYFFVFYLEWQDFEVI